MKVELGWGPAFIWLSLFVLAAPGCSDSTRRTAPLLSIEGAGVAQDPTAAAHWAVDFGEGVVGAERRIELTLTNRGDAPLHVAPEPLPSPFRSNLANLRLAPGEGRTIWVGISPREEGAFEGTIHLRTNEERHGVSLRLHGTAHPTTVACEPVQLLLPPVVRGESRTGTVSCKNLLATPTTLSLATFEGKHRAHFAASFGEGAVVELAGGATATLEITFAPDFGLESGPVGAGLAVLDPAGGLVQQLQVESTVQGQALEILVERGGVERPIDTCHTFEATAEGDRTQQRFVVRNWSQQPVLLRSVEVEGGGDGFSLHSAGLPRSLAGGGGEAQEIEVSFHPPAKGIHGAQLVATSDDRLEPKGGVRACLRGQGGGAILRCFPSHVDFDGVALGTTVTRALRCTNASTDDDILYVEGVTTSAPDRFTATVPASQGYLPGEEFTVEIAYTPQEEATDTATLTIQSSAVGSQEYALVGRGRDLPACVYELHPPYLRFGVTSPGTQLTLAATLRNLLDADCIVSNARLSPTTSSAFHMNEVEGRVVPAKGRLPLEVTFAPTELGQSHTGELLFSVSHPDEPHGSIPLSGMAGEPCLVIDPPTIDFGKTPPHCSTREVFASIHNACLFDVTVEDLTVAGEFFGARSMPLLPLILEPTQRVELSLVFQPEESGLSFGSLAIDASSGGEAIGPFLLPLVGEGSLDVLQTDTFLDGDAAPKVDFLVVMDNSSGVDMLHAVFHENLGRLMQFAVDNGTDFQLGVTTTGVDYALTTGCPGGFDGNEDGRLFPAVSKGRPRILHAGMPRQQLMDHLAANLSVGVCHHAEAPYEAARRALSPPHITTPLADNGNQGFLRRDAALSILIATDESDVDSMWDGDPNADSSVERYVRFFQSLKPSWDRHAVKIHAISGGNAPCTGGGGALACPRCVRGTELTGGVWADFCRDSTGATWEEDFDAISEAVFGRPLGYPLRGLPGDRNGDGRVDHQDIEVRVNGRLVPGMHTSGRAWSYAASTNSVVFTPKHRPGPDQLVEITYELGCIPPG